MSEPEKITVPIQPLELMGWFWSAFGVIVLATTFFVEENEYVPLARGIATNIVSSLILLGVGAFSILRGRKQRRKAMDAARQEDSERCS